MSEQMCEPLPRDVFKLVGASEFRFFFFWRTRGVRFLIAYYLAFPAGKQEERTGSKHKSSFVPPYFSYMT